VREEGIGRAASIGQAFGNCQGIVRGISCSPLVMVLSREVRKRIDQGKAGDEDRVILERMEAASGRHVWEKVWDAQLRSQAGLILDSV